LFLGNVTGNPGVFQGNPYPYPSKPVPVVAGTGFDGYGLWVFTNPRETTLIYCIIYIIIYRILTTRVVEALVVLKMKRTANEEVGTSSLW